MTTDESWTTVTPEPVNFMECSRCHHTLQLGQLVVRVERVVGIVAPDHPDGYPQVMPHHTFAHVDMEQCHA